MEENARFPGWVGPLLGPVLGAVVALKVDSDDGFDPVIRIAMGAGLGLAAGLVVWWMDARKPRH